MSCGNGYVLSDTSKTSTADLRFQRCASRVVITLSFLAPLSNNTTPIGKGMDREYWILFKDVTQARAGTRSTPFVDSIEHHGARASVLSKKKSILGGRQR